MILKLGSVLAGLLEKAAADSVTELVTLEASVVDALTGVKNLGALQALQDRGTHAGWDNDAVHFGTRFGHIYKVTDRKVRFQAVNTDAMDILLNLTVGQTPGRLIIEESSVTSPVFEIEFEPFHYPEGEKA